MDVQRIAAFSHGEIGGNPAGVVICEQLPEASVMQAMAAKVGYSETAFAAPTEGGWRVRYFAPEIEVPFCGHATIALGAALALKHGDGIFALTLNEVKITVQGEQEGKALHAALQSPPTFSEAAPQALTDAALALFSLTKDELDLRIPPAIAHAGATHLVLALNRLDLVQSMQYNFTAGRDLMLQHGVATVILAYAKTPQLFHVRNPFAAGGVYEDPATGAAAAALCGYLRDCNWPHGGHIDIVQGEEMGIPSRIRVDMSSTAGESVRVSGRARMMH